MKRGLRVDELEKISKSFSIKAEDDKLLEESFSKQDSQIYVFIKTYYDTLDQGTCLAIGRKGSGKSALLIAYKSLNRDYLKQSNIELDKFPLGTIVNLMNEVVVSNNHELTELFTELWTKSILFSSLDNIIPLLIKSDDYLLSTDEIEQLSKIHTEINTLKKEDNNKGALFYFVFFFRKVLNEFEIKFDLDDNTSLLATPLALALNYAIQKINGITLNDYTVEEVSNLVSKVLFEKKKNFLLSFDKYDDFIDTTVESLRKSEINLYDFHHEMIIQTLLKSLMLAAKEIKKNESYTWIHLLVTIPFDKFIELRFREKLAMDEHITYLRWSPLDLYKFITYRIGSALNLNMNETLGIWYNIFPKDIPNGLFKNRLEDTFLYLIRHSLWRPREILKYVQNIVKEAIVMIEEKKYDNTFLFSSEEWAAIFNKAISETSVYLISSEFIPEYQVQYPNIQEVLNTIKHSPKSKTILPKHQWINILKDTTLSSQITNPEDILIRLYQMGVVGVRTQVPSHRQSTEFSPIIVQYNINYMYTFGLYEIELNPFSKNVDVVVNPLFYDYLELEHNAKDNSQEIIPCQLTWKSMAIDITDEIHDFIGE